MKVPVWGNAAPAEKVTVSFGGQTKTATAASDGKWTLLLDPMPADATPKEMTISGSNTVTLKNVLVGEVWLASGQSNMGLSVNEALNKEQEIASANFPLIREFDVEHAGSLTPLDQVKAKWAVCSPSTVARFSAVAYFFGRELHESLKVPIGIIHSSYGGTPAEAWTSREALNTVPELKTMADQQIAAMQASPEDLKNFPGALKDWEEKYGVHDGENEGFKNGWAAPETDTSDWKKVDAGFNWEKALGAKGGGVIWLRKDLDLPESAAGKPFRMTFGYLNEQYHKVYFNGEEVGTMGSTPPDFYTGGRSANIPGKLVKAGRNVIAFRFVSATPKGGFYVVPNQMSLPVPDAKSISNTWLVKAEKLFPPLPAEAEASRPKLNKANIQNTATALFNAMIQPLIPAALRGVVWYQGESNSDSMDRAKMYRKLLPTLIGDWRSRWEEGDLPFYIVQLANFGTVDKSHRTNPWAIVREAQSFVSKSVPASGLAVTIDVGDVETIHPRDKQDVGKRLAAWALAQNYGQKAAVHQSPSYKTATVEGNQMRVKMDLGTNASKLMVGEKKGLDPVHEVPAGKLTWFEIAGADQKFSWAEAKIEGDSVIVSSPDVPAPTAVRYAWAADPDGCNLYSNTGLPASPFRTDDWP